MTAHILQSHVNTCLAACACMILNRSGHLCTEDELMEQWGPPPARGYEHQLLRHVLPGAQYRYLDLDQPTGWSLLEAQLHQQWMIALMFTGAMTVFAREHQPSLISRYGALCTTYDDRASLLNVPDLHAVVLCERVEGGVMFLDPYHEPAHQPLFMSDQWLVLAASGMFWGLS